MKQKTTANGGNSETYKTVSVVVLSVWAQNMLRASVGNMLKRMRLKHDSGLGPQTSSP